jgi:hypothetical protein
MIPVHAQAQWFPVYAKARLVSVYAKGHFIGKQKPIIFAAYLLFKLYPALPCAVALPSYHRHPAQLAAQFFTLIPLFPPLSVCIISLIVMWITCTKARVSVRCTPFWCRNSVLKHAFLHAFLCIAPLFGAGGCSPRTYCPETFPSLLTCPWASRLTMTKSGGWVASELCSFTCLSIFLWCKYV